MGLPNIDYQYEENELRSLYVEREVDRILDDARELSETIASEIYSEGGNPTAYDHYLMRLSTCKECEQAHYINEFQLLVRDIVTKQVEENTPRRQAL